MTWNTYCIGPIDIGWGYLPRVDEVRKQVAEFDEEDTSLGADYLLPKFERDVAQARDEGLRNGWKGEFLEGGMRVLWQPGDVEFDHGFVWKSPDNGLVYVVSPNPLPYLEKL